MTNVELASAAPASRRREHASRRGRRRWSAVHRRVRQWPAALRELEVTVAAVLEQLALAERHIAEHQHHAAGGRRAAVMLDGWDTTLRELVERCRELEHAEHYALALSVPEILIRRHSKLATADRERLDGACSYDAPGPAAAV